MASINQYFLLMSYAIALVLVHCGSHALCRPLDSNNTALSMRDRHEQWMAKYGRTYKDLSEKEKRFNIFKENVERIESFNRASSLNHKLYKLGVNVFADLTTEEFRATHTSFEPCFSLQSMFGGSTTNNFKYENVTNVPPSMDWREKGAVTHVKEQGDCGLNQINTGNLISLSEQQLNDCDKTNHGCTGGSIKKAFKFIQQNQGILTEQVYPYKAIQGQCQTLQGHKVTINGFEKVPAGNEHALLQAVSKQPVAVRVDNSGFQLYQGGIFNGECGTKLNHDVTIVGYGTENGNDYWLVKNSWGANWGESGFMRIIRGLNMCGLTAAPSYPI
ncbi:Senescence-specific cysteine protease SAG39 [Bienertia sinuspersici]